MATNQLKIVISVLRELQEHNVPAAYDYEIEKEKFGDIIELMQDSELIKNVQFFRGKGNRIIKVLPENTKVTLKGLEYLDRNSILAKSYRGLKEIREWLPF